MENNNVALKLHSLCFGGHAWRKRKVYSVVSHILISHNMKQKFKLNARNISPPEHLIKICEGKSLKMTSRE